MRRTNLGRALRARLSALELLDGALGLGERGLGTRWKRRVRAAASGAAALLRAARGGWRRWGYYGALAILVCILGLTSVRYGDRNKGAARQSLPAATPAPAVAEAAEALGPLTESAARAEDERTFRLPVCGRVLTEFCADALVWSDTLEQWQAHPGVDIACLAGEAVLAPADGVVTDAYMDPLYGGVICLDHGDGWHTRLMSLSTVKRAAVGDRVRAGDVISAGGAGPWEAEMGNHVHVELSRDGEKIDFLSFAREASA